MQMRQPMATDLAAEAPPAAGRAASLELALIGNCAISALVDQQGAVVWGCMPRFDGDPVFSSLLDSAHGLPREGSMLVELKGLTRVEQSYEHGTAILKTRLLDANGHGIEISDFAPRFFHRDRIFRPAQLVRRIRPLAGHPRIRVTVNPRGEWGSVTPTITRGSNHLRFVLPSGTLRLTTNAPPTYLADGTWFSLHGPVSLLFGPDETLSGGIEETAREFEEQTSLYWRHWTRRLALPLEWQEAVIRAAITLKLCQFEETGAIVAAMTTSIPEAPNSGRNWDYRFCWLRDAFFVVRALNSLSEVGTMEDYLRWLYDVVRSSEDGHVQPLYGIGLERQLSESIVPHLAGYRGMGRCGSATRRTSISSTTSTATSSSARPRPSTTTASSVAPTPRTSRRSRRWASRHGECTTSRTPACGSCAAGPGCTRRRP